jgi:1-acyl-sn-glycerol-3-phosphate acyltransferase
MWRRIPLGRYFWGVVLKLLICMELRVQVRERGRVPAAGAGIVYYNHIHWLDPVIISSALPRYNVPLTKIEASRWPLVGWLLRWYHVIFITRGTVDREALRATWQVLANGDVSVISPEGTRSPTGQLQEAKEGLAFVARQAPDAWLIPCAVTGTPAFKWRFPFLRRTVVTLTFGQPFRLRWPRAADGRVAIPEGRAGRQILREMTDQAMARLAAVLPAAVRGAYNQADPTRHTWLEFGAIKTE